MPEFRPLSCLFAPQSVAVIGASATAGKVGHTVVKNMVEAGFAGGLYPVNPKGGEIMGKSVTTSIADLPPGLDMAVVCLPRGMVVEAARELAGRRCGAVVVITAGFKEVGGEGYHAEKELAEVCDAAGMHLLGPNCLGMINGRAGVNASFAAGRPADGSIAFFSQSGALCTAILDWALGQDIGFSKFVSLGNKARIDEATMLDYLADDPDTKVILGYIENVESGERFLRAARRVTARKPVIIIKSGTTAAGARAASSHTGAIAGADQAYEAAFKQTGVIRARDVQTLFNLAEAFSTQPLPTGPNLTIVTNAGGPGIIATDAAARSSLRITRASAETIEKLQSFLPSYAALFNPIDILGDAAPERFRRAVSAALDERATNAVLVVLAKTTSTDVEGSARAVIEAARRSDKPVYCCFMGKKHVAPGRRLLQEAGIPCYEFPEPAVAAIEAMYRQFMRRGRPEPVYPDIKGNRIVPERIIAEARGRGETEIVEFQAQDILRAYGLPTPQTRLARSSFEAVAAAEEIGYPVVLKIASPQISHKSDVGGVAVNVADMEQVKQAFWDLTSRAQRLRPEAYIAGCLVQQMAPRGSKEVIIGFKRDPQFGPLVMFGLGGIYVEVLKDIAFRLAPLSTDDAFAILREIKSYLLLKGVLGEAPADFPALQDILLRMSRFALDFPEVAEAEFNPVLVGPDGALVADVRMTLEPVKNGGGE